MNKLKDHPTDGISCIRFAPKTNTLAASSWDSVSSLFKLISRHSIFIHWTHLIVFKPINPEDLFSVAISLLMNRPALVV